MYLMEAKAKYGLSAGWRYSSGKLHAAWDIRTPSGIELHSDVGGLVRDVNDGVANNRPGHNPGTGAPSNWVLLHTPYGEGTATVLINHLSPGLNVRKGQRIERGTLLGTSGNSGFSTGPHTHVATFSGDWSGPYRYQYLEDTDLIIWEPSKVLDLPTPPPLLKEDQVVVILINHKGKRYACYPAAGVKRHIASPTQERNIRTIIQRSGGRIIEWSDSKDVDDPDAFGKTI